MTSHVLKNDAGLGLAMAVWLAHDEYDSGANDHPDEEVISATTLLKPTRQLILSNRIESDAPDQVQEMDVTDFIASRFGTAIHDSVESAWVKGYADAMKKLGYPQKLIDRVRINPETVEDGDVPVYLEQRYFRPIMIGDKKIIISGKFDQIIGGEVNDTKTTSVWGYLNGSKTEDYSIQGSIYRWISPDKVTSDVMRVQHVFTDWQRSQVKITPGYPEHRVHEVAVDLMTLQETESWIKRKINEILANQNRDQSEMVRCSDKELWMSEPVFKYYSDPQKAAAGGRSTKNFSTYPAAAEHCHKSGKGVVVEVPGEPKACNYCAGAPICEQRLEYQKD